jgi:hypothetical protein
MEAKHLCTQSHLPKLGHLLGMGGFTKAELEDMQRSAVHAFTRAIGHNENTPNAVKFAPKECGLISDCGSKLLRPVFAGFRKKFSMIRQLRSD